MLEWGAFWSKNTLPSNIYIYSSSDLCDSLVRLEFEKTKDGMHTVKLDNRWIASMFNVVGNDLWKKYCESEDVKPEKMLGVTIGKRDMFISVAVASDAVKFFGTSPHEVMHRLSKLSNPMLREGSAERLMYEYVRKSDKVPEEAREQIKISPGHRIVAAIDYLTEQIVGRDNYLYAHAKGGEKHLADVFQKVVGNEGPDYYDLFGGRINGESVIKILKGSIDNLDMPEAQKDHIIRNVDKIMSEGEYDI
jgi:hypothetical protein